MIARRLPFVVVGAALAGLLVVDRAETEPVPAATYGQRPLVQSTPALFKGDVLSTSWFCPGGPTIGDRSTSVTMFNSTDDPREVTVSAVSEAGVRGSVPLTLPPRNRAVVNLADLAAGEHTAATVAAYGGGVAVEQTVVGRSGVATSPCADRASSSWYLADGTTTQDAAFILVLYNPFPDDAVVDVSLTTIERTLEPPGLQAVVVPGQSLRIFDITQAAQREELVSTVVRGRGARIVAGRIQSSDNPNRRGFAAGVAAAQPQQTWWFPDGGKGEGVVERFVVFNPGELDAAVDLSFLPADGVAPPAPVSIVVPPSSFQLVDVDALAEVSPGDHSTVVNVVGDETPVVVERLLTRPVDDTPVTTILLGSQLTVPQWYVIEEAAARGGVVVVMNSAGLPTTAAVKAIGPAGAVPVPGFEAVPIPAGGSAAITIPETVGGFPLLVEGAQPIVVEWRARADAGDRVSRVDALAFPVIGG
ncbi:MAG TPA: DUF5719 family protein [Acidimicrobiales bacterium]|nr:DUF5719 family protein [Acidimicrobiales bacterium]